MTRKEKLIAMLQDENVPPMKEAEIALCMGVAQASMDKFHKIITELILSGIAVTDKKGRIYSAEAAGFLRGTLRANSKGFGFLLRDDGGEDLYIPATDMNGAIDGDVVLVRPRKHKKGERPEGSVFFICSRSITEFVGILETDSSMRLVANPDNEKLPSSIPLINKATTAQKGQKALFAIEYSPKGEIMCSVREVLGYPDDFGVDVLSVIKEYGFATEFPKAVIKEAQSTPDRVSPEEIQNRLDLRGEAIITIDSEDSKDLDDAVSLKKTENGWRLGVHIADVSHYVRPKSAMDKEAYNRGTSVYLVDRVIPMLMPKLSNGICSLNEGVDRLTLSVIMDMDLDANVIHTEFYKSVIKTAHRMTYNNVWKIIHGDGEVRERYSDVASMIDNMYALSLKLKEKSALRGYVELDIPEAKAVLDENGKAIGIELRSVNEANELIEQFMVSANMAVAQYLWENHFPAVYRVHDDPPQNKVEAFNKFMWSLGYKPEGNLRALMDSIQDDNDKKIAAVMALRAMAKAAYSPANSGHYGLGAEFYCHFTSPIRRYPDLICHRSLKAAIEHDEAALKAIGKMNADAATQSSERELAAEKCERDTLNMKKAEYMSQFLGQEFNGVISSVTSFGFYVQLPNTVEGLVTLNSLSDDYYVFDEEKLCLVGERLKKVYRIGDEVCVILASTNKRLGQISFAVKGIKADKRCKKPPLSKAEQIIKSAKSKRRKNKIGAGKRKHGRKKNSRSK